MKWKIYYDDGSTYSNEDGSLENTPGLGVQALVKSDEMVGRIMLSGNDFYWWNETEWLGGDIFGLWDYLQQSGWKKIIFGRVINTGKFRKIYQAAHDDMDFPRKSAWHHHEKKPNWLKA